MALASSSSVDDAALPARLLQNQRMPTPDSPRPSPPARGRRWRRWLIDALIVVVIIVSVRTWMQRGMVDGEAPELTATTLDGAAVQPWQALDTPVVVHFWATWCRVCALTQPGIDRLAGHRPVITVALRSGDADAVGRHLQRHALSHPVVLDDDGSIAEDFGVRGVPASFIIDSHGRIRYRNTGLTPGWELRLRMWWVGLRS